MKMLRHVSARIALIMVFLILPLNIIAMIYTHNAQKTIVDQEVFNTQKLADYQMQQLEKQMDSARTLLMIFLTQDADLLKIKNENTGDYEYESSKLKFYYRLKNMAEASDGADGYYYWFPKRQDGVVYGNADGKGQLVQTLRDMLSEYDGKRYPSGWHIYEWDKARYLIFLAADTQMVWGAAIRLDPFERMIAQSTAYPDTRITLTESGAGQEGEWSGQAENRDVGQGTGKTREEDTADRATDGKMIEIKSQCKNLCLTMELNRMEILKNVAFPQRLLMITAVSWIFLIPVLYGVLQLLLIGPLHRINEAHRQIEQGNTKYRIREIPSTVEFGELSLSFNRMVDHLERLRIESYEKELSRQKMELQNLQLQIRPHFLFNTFNLIFTLSQKKENGAIQRTVIWLSEYFRYIFREEKELELFSRERKLIEGYVQMAAIRYSGRITAEYEFDENIDLVRVPPLLIRNFVENAVKYGVKKDEILKIRLEGRYENGMATILIRDNGKGMTEEMLKRNRAMLSGEWEPESQTEHLGIYNSLRRMKFFYGEEARIAVSSRPGEGACFEVRFPYVL